MRVPSLSHQGSLGIFSRPKHVPQECEQTHIRPLEDYEFHHILLAEANLKARPDSRGGEADSKISLKGHENREWGRIIVHFAIN